MDFRFENNTAVEKVAAGREKLEKYVENKSEENKTELTNALNTFQEIIDLTSGKEGLELRVNQGNAFLLVSKVVLDDKSVIQQAKNAIDILVEEHNSDHKEYLNNVLQSHL